MICVENLIIYKRVTEIDVNFNKVSGIEINMQNKLFLYTITKQSKNTIYKNLLTNNLKL